MMRSILYKSRRATGLSASDIDEIVSVSVRNNARRGLTGWIVSQDESFLQYLEGPGEALDELFVVLKKDPRHLDIEILKDRPIEKRACPNWGMHRPVLGERESRTASRVLQASKASSDLLSNAISDIIHVGGADMFSRHRKNG